MSDNDFVDVGDELVVRIGGYPVAKAKIVQILSDHALAAVQNETGQRVVFELPLDVKSYDTVDGVAHTTAPVENKCDKGCQPDWHRDDCAIYIKPEVNDFGEDANGDYPSDTAEPVEEHKCYCGRDFKSWRDLYDHEVGYHGWGKEDN